MNDELQFKNDSVTADPSRTVTPEPVELNEESFYTPSVRAVAFYPKTMLQQDEDTTVFVVVDRDAIGANK